MNVRTNRLPDRGVTYDLDRVNPARRQSGGQGLAFTFKLFLLVLVALATWIIAYDAMQTRETVLLREYINGRRSGANPL